MSRHVFLCTLAAKRSASAYGLPRHICTDFSSRLSHFRQSGIGCSHWSSRSAHSTPDVTASNELGSVRHSASPSFQNDVGFMEDASDEDFADHDEHGDVDAAGDSHPLEIKDATPSPRPRLPTSMKKLNKALGRKEVIEIPDHDVVETFVRGRGPGGQAINKTNSSVSLVHIPTGIRIQSQPTRSREQNRIAARRILAEKLDELRAKGMPAVPHQTAESDADGGPSPLGPANKASKRESRKQEEKDLAAAYTKSELRAAKERARKLNRAKKHKKKKRKMEEEESQSGSGEDSG